MDSHFKKRQRPFYNGVSLYPSPTLRSSDLALICGLHPKLDVDSLYSGMPKRGSMANPMESSNPEQTNYSRNRDDGRYVVHSLHLGLT
jgi:hypothetical protein